MLELIDAACNGRMRTHEQRFSFYRHHEAMLLPSIHAFSFPDGSVARWGGSTLVVCKSLADFMDHKLGGGCPSWRDALRHSFRRLMNSILFDTDPDQLKRAIDDQIQTCIWKMPVEYVVDPD